jgi:hypothetical protein
MACPGSWGWQLTAILLGAGGLYVGGGLVFGARQGRDRGGLGLLSVHPHAARWGEVAALCTDGLAFVQGRGQRSGASGSLSSREAQQDDSSQAPLFAQRDRQTRDTQRSPKTNKAGGQRKKERRPSPKQGSGRSQAPPPPPQETQQPASTPPQSEQGASVGAGGTASAGGGRWVRVAAVAALAGSSTSSNTTTNSTSGAMMSLGLSMEFVVDPAAGRSLAVSVTEGATADLHVLINSRDAANCSCSAESKSSGCLITLSAPARPADADASSQLLPVPTQGMAQVAVYSRQETLELLHVFEGEPQQRFQCFLNRLPVPTLPRRAKDSNQSILSGRVYCNLR